MSSSPGPSRNETVCLLPSVSTVELSSHCPCRVVSEILDSGLLESIKEDLHHSGGSVYGSAHHGATHVTRRGTRGYSLGYSILGLGPSVDSRTVHRREIFCLSHTNRGLRRCDTGRLPSASVVRKGLVLR